jgi:hypothetical protein
MQGESQFTIQRSFNLLAFLPIRWHFHRTIAIHMQRQESENHITILKRSLIELFLIKIVSVSPSTPESVGGSRLHSLLNYVVTDERSRPRSLSLPLPYQQ